MNSLVGVMVIMLPIVLKTVVDSIPSSVQSNSIKLIFDALMSRRKDCLV